MALPDRIQDAADGELLGGGAAGFTTLYRRLETPVLRYFVRRSADPDVAADLAAETFARAWSERQRFDPARGDARAWVFGIARNVLLDSYRRGQVDDRVRRRLGMERLVLDDEALERVAALAAEPVALEALATLPADQRKAVQGRVLDEEPYEELAAGLRCSEGVVRQRVSRGLRALQLRLKETSR
jgi:RNA polymerase sigma factor (sigma-70 family)